MKKSSTGSLLAHPTVVLVFVTVSLRASADNPTPKQQCGSPAACVEWFVPEFHDLTIKLRNDPSPFSNIGPGITWWYFHGARQRNEWGPDNNSHAANPAFIWQCDKKTVFHLEGRTKTYFRSEFPPDYRESSGHANNGVPSSFTEVIVTISSVDTGERRAIGDYQARHIKTNITVEPNKPSAPKPPQAELDSWYLELPGLYCRSENPRHFALLVQALEAEAQRNGSIKPGSSSIVTDFSGPTPDGLLIEETLTKRFGGKTIVDKTELMEVSQEPLDNSLFTVPADYKLEDPYGSRNSLPPRAFPVSPNSH